MAKYGFYPHLNELNSTRLPYRHYLAKVLFQLQVSENGLQTEHRSLIAWWPMNYCSLLGMGKSKVLEAH